MKYFILILVLIFNFCASEPTGQFGWNIQSKVEKDLKLKGVLTQRHYTITTEKIIFNTNNTISYLYEFQQLPSKRKVEVSLEKLTLDYTEISTSSTIINSDNQIWGIYENLEVGKYRIRLSSDLEVFDSAEFEVIE